METSAKSSARVPQLVKYLREQPYLHNILIAFKCKYHIASYIHFSLFSSFSLYIIHVQSSLPQIPFLKERKRDETKKNNPCIFWKLSQNFSNLAPAPPSQNLRRKRMVLNSLGGVIPRPNQAHFMAISLRSSPLRRHNR